MNRQYFDFSGLIAKYSNPFIVVTHESSGYDSRGKWKDGQEKRETFTGAIIAYRESKIFRYEGAITAKDKLLLMVKRLPKALIGAEVEFRGQKYKIESELENAEFTGVFIYVLKWVSAFDAD